MHLPRVFTTLNYTDPPQTRSPREYYAFVHNASKSAMRGILNNDSPSKARTASNHPVHGGNGHEKTSELFSERSVGSRDDSGHMTFSASLYTFCSTVRFLPSHGGRAGDCIEVMILTNSSCRTGSWAWRKSRVCNGMGRMHCNCSVSTGVTALMSNISRWNGSSFVSGLSDFLCL